MHKENKTLEKQYSVMICFPSYVEWKVTMNIYNVLSNINVDASRLYAACNWFISNIL